MQNNGISASSLANLTERLKSKTEEDRQTAERQIEAEFKTLSVNVRESMKSALATIEDAMRRETATLSESLTRQARLLNSGLIRHWLMVGLLGLALISGLAVGGLGLATLAQRHVSHLRQNLAYMSQEKARLETALKQLESNTWGLSLVETPEGRFIILPQKATPKTGWTFGKQPAIKLE